MKKFKWPKKQPLQKKLKDLLETKVPEKYYLSQEKIESISKWNSQQKPLENMENMEKNGYSGTLTTRDGDEQSGMKLIKEIIKKEQPFGTFSQENVVSSKEDETISTLTSTGAFSRHKIVENVFESRHHSGKIHNPEGIASAFKENHSTAIFIKEAKNGDGVYIDRPNQKRGVVQKGMIQTLKTEIDAGIVDKKLRIRKITPREALRLMGLDDKRIDVIQNSKLISHNKQYFLAGNSIVVPVLEAIFKQIDLPKDRPLKVFEMFAGYGSQTIALENLGYEISKESAISEWYVDAIIAHALLHNNDIFQHRQKMFGLLNKEELLLLINDCYNTFSTDSKKPNNLKRLERERLINLLAAYEASRNLGSITDISGHDIIQKFDLLTYSFPCQDLSLAGKQKGMTKESGTRSGLLWEVERILLELKEVDQLPSVLLMENVPQIHSKNHNEDFQKWQLALMEMGYKNTWKDLNAKDFGVPQNRNRTFMISILEGEVENETSVQLALDLEWKGGE